MSTKQIFLLGSMKNQIIGSKLPSKGDVLRVVFYNMREVNLNLHDSISLAIDECLIYWKKARIPTQDRSDCVKKCKKLYETWRGLEKHKTRKSDLCRQQEKEFQDSFDDLFDIAHSNALNMIKIEEDKTFLSMQRQKGRIGCMLSIDRKLTAAEQRKTERVEKELERKNMQHSSNTDTECGYLSSSPETSAAEDAQMEFTAETSKSLDVDDDTENVSHSSFHSSNLKSKRARKEILTSRLSAALDKCKVSDRDSVHILTACLEAVNLNPREYVINRASIKRGREKFRELMTFDVRSKFIDLNLDFVVIHWDSKILPNITGEKSVDRLPVIATSLNVEQLLGVPELSSGTGFEMASAVYDTLQEWLLLDKVEAFVFDTTASNTGRLNGACYLLEQKLNRDILFLACRHHIYEIVLQGVFNEINLSPSKGPEITLFKRFKNIWENVNKTQFLNWKTDKYVEEILKDDVNELSQYAQNKINEGQPRDDYREFLELIIIFLGNTPSRGIQFRKPGAYHLARWMAKAIYCLKIFLFRQQIKLTKTEEKSLKQICCFIIKCYAKPWFSAANAIDSPVNDINFLKQLVEYKNDNKIIAEKAIHKFINHLWYLSEECAAFSIFDDRINDEMRRRMAKKLLQTDLPTNNTKTNKTEHETEEEKKNKLFIKADDLEYFLNKNLPLDLISNNSQNMLTRFHIPLDFLKIDPVHWKDQESYKKGKEIMASIRVVNDTAERGVKLKEEFNDKFTKNEDQKQYVLQVVSDYRKTYPRNTRETLNKK